MKKRFIVLSSLITILLASFPLVVFADETLQDSSNLHSLSDGVFLDSYFYDNYDLLPYLESSGSQYIDTGIKASSDLAIEFIFSDIKKNANLGYSFLFGSNLADTSPYFGIRCNFNSTDQYTNNIFYFDNAYYQYKIENIDPYMLNNIKYLSNELYLNNNLLYTFPNVSYSNNSNIYIFNSSENNSPSSRYAYFKLYKFSIYDYSLNNGEGGYVRYYYPAKSKSSDTLGLYDAVNKTFYSSLTSYPFINPTDDKVLNFQIGDFVTSGLGWIDDIFDFVIATPIILFFFAVALAGSVYRWARRVVHF